MTGSTPNIDEQPVPLNFLQPGQFGRISGVLGVSDEVHRFSEMGLRDGAQVEMLQSGRSCVIRLNGHKLCFRTDDSTCILVCPLAANMGTR